MEIEHSQNYSFKDFESDQNFKISDDRLPQNEHYSVYDVSLKQKNEYQVFHSQFEKYSAKTRRGLTFLQNKQNPDDYQVIRKGLPKFFDLDNKQFINTENPKLSLWGKDVNIGLNNIEKQEQFQVYLTKKLNGMNIQISYCDILDKFLISTKNNCLIAKDIQEATKDVDYFTQHNADIAYYFFEEMNKKSVEEQDQIKKTLQQYTMVGEYVGGCINQHVTNELEPYFQFFALVKKNCFEDDIVLTEQAENTITKCGFKFVEYTKFQGTKQAFFEVLNLHLKKCAEEDLNKIGEGYVLYIEYKDKNVLICKMKGLEYRIERKLREFAKQLYQENEKDINKLEKKCQKEYQKMLKEYNLQKEEMLLKYKNIKQNMNQIINDFESNTLNVNDWIGYRFKLNQEQFKKPIYIVLPIGVPGSGKSYFYSQIIQKVCLDQNYQSQYISSDEIRNKLMQKRLKKHPNLIENPDQLFEDTTFMSRKIFDDQLIRCLTSAKYDIRKINQNALVLFLDKNFNRRSLGKTIDLIKHELLNQNYRIILSAPKVDQQKVIPLNDQDILICLKQIKNRNNHLTLQYEGTKTLQILKNFTSNFEPFLVKSFDIDEILQYGNFQDIQIQEDTIKKLNDVKTSEDLDHLLDSIELNQNNQQNLQNQLATITQIFGENLNKQIERTQSFKYLGICVKEYKKKLMESLKEELLFQNKQTLLGSIFNDKNWKKIEDLHITLIHQNDLSDGNFSEKIQQFQENQKVEIEIRNIVITDKLNVNFFVEIPQEIQIDNRKQHHITFATMDSSPYVSNFILQFLQKKKRLCQDTNFKEQYKFKQNLYDCYVFGNIFQQKIIGYTKKFYYQLKLKLIYCTKQCYVVNNLQIFLLWVITMISNRKKTLHQKIFSKKIIQNKEKTVLKTWSKIKIQI